MKGLITGDREWKSPGIKWPQICLLSNSNKNSTYPACVRKVLFDSEMRDCAWEYWQLASFIHIEKSVTLSLLICSLQDYPWLQTSFSSPQVEQGSSSGLVHVNLLWNIPLGSQSGFSRAIERQGRCSAELPRCHRWKYGMNCNLLVKLGTFERSQRVPGSQLILVLQGEPWETMIRKLGISAIHGSWLPLLFSEMETGPRMSERLLVTGRAQSNRPKPSLQGGWQGVEPRGVCVFQGRGGGKPSANHLVAIEERWELFRELMLAKGEKMTSSKSRQFGNDKISCKRFSMI